MDRRFILATLAGILTLVVYWRGELSLRGGAVAGGLLGLLMAATYDLSQFGTVEHWTLQPTLVEPFITMTMVAIAGAVVGAILGKPKRHGPAEPRA